MWSSCNGRQLSMRRGIHRTTWFSRWGGKLSYSLFNARMMVFFVMGKKFSSNNTTLSSHTFSMEFKSGERADHSMRWIPSASRQLCTDGVQWQDALLSIKRNFSPTAPRKSQTCECRRFSMYRLSVIHPWSVHRNPCGHWTGCLYTQNTWCRMSF